MKSTFIILNILFLSNILCIKYKELSFNKLYNIEQEDEEVFRRRGVQLWILAELQVQHRFPRGRSTVCRTHAAQQPR